MKEEEWRDIKGYEGLYIISSYGRVKSLGNGKTHNSNEKILAYSIGKKGYKSVALSKDGNIKRYLVHRLVAEAFIPNPNNYPVINHKDENPSNNCVFINEDGTVDLEKSNIEWCTHKYNSNYGNCRKKITEANIGRKLSQETKDKISEKHIGKEPWNKGKTDIYTQETIDKMSLRKKGKPNIKLAKPVLQLDKDTEEVIKEWASISEARRQLGISHIDMCLTGKRKTCGGFKWRYKNG